MPFRTHMCREFLEFPAAVSLLMQLTPEDVVEQLKKRERALEGALARIENQLQTAMAEGLPRLFLLETEYQRAMFMTEWNGFDPSLTIYKRKNCNGMSNGYVP